MKVQWRRVSTTIRLVGILIILAVVGVVVYQLYDFYGERVGFTAPKAIDAYFLALSQGDYEQVYQLTDTEYLADIYGRPVTKAEFTKQLKQLTGDERLPIQTIKSEKLAESQGWRYYVVTLSSSINGTAGSSRVIVQMHKLGGDWVIVYPFPIVL